jgi:intracellular septation protein
VAYNFSTSAWVSFKVFGPDRAEPAFIVAQGFYISRYLTDEEPEPSRPHAPQGAAAETRP